MATRLGFAVIEHVEPETLLIDEILAIGDAEEVIELYRNPTAQYGLTWQAGLRLVQGIATRHNSKRQTRVAFISLPRSWCRLLENKTLAREAAPPTRWLGAFSAIWPPVCIHKESP